VFSRPEEGARGETRIGREGEKVCGEESVGVVAAVMMVGVVKVRAVGAGKRGSGGASQGC